MLLSHTQLINTVVNGGMLQGIPDLDNVNGSSIDITLGSTLLIEKPPKVHCPSCGHETAYANTPDMNNRENRSRDIHCPFCFHTNEASKWFTPVNIEAKEPLNMESMDCTDGFTLWPGEVCLAHSVEVFHLPYNITAEYRLKSSQGRVFLEHLHAGWCDPGWHGSVLTLEFANMSKFHPVTLRAGMKCGQVMFYSHDPVPEDKSYAVRGQYNKDTTATPSKGAK